MCRILAEGSHTVPVHIESLDLCLESSVTHVLPMSWDQRVLICSLSEARSTGEGTHLGIHPAGGRVNEAAAVQRARQLDHLLGVVLAPALIEHHPHHNAGEAPVLLHTIAESIMSCLRCHELPRPSEPGKPINVSWKGYTAMA